MSSYEFIDIQYFLRYRRQKEWRYRKKECKMVLTNILLKNATPKTKPYKVFDGQGLYVVVTPAGNKLWRFDYSINRKRKTLSLGMYPAVSLKEARIKRDEAKVLLLSRTKLIPHYQGHINSPLLPEMGSLLLLHLWAHLFSI